MNDHTQPHAHDAELTRRLNDLHNHLDAVFAADLNDPQRTEAFRAELARRAAGIPQGASRGSENASPVPGPSATAVAHGVDWLTLVDVLAIVCAVLVVFGGGILLTISAIAAAVFYGAHAVIKYRLHRDSKIQQHRHGTLAYRTWRTTDYSLQASETATERDSGMTPAGDGGELCTTGPREVAELLSFARDLASMPADERLRTRVWLPRPRLSTIRALVGVGHQARNELIALTVALADALPTDGRPARGLLSVPRRTRMRAVKLGLALTDLGARDLARDLDRDLLDALDHVVHLGHTLTLTRTRVNTFAQELTLDHALDHARVLAREVEVDVDLVLDFAGTAQKRLMSAYARAVTADRSTTNLREEDLLDAVEIIERVISDMVGANLEDVDLAHVPLEGVWWSRRTTRWPPVWRDEVYRRSTPKGPDLWEIGDRGVDARHFATTT
jgi:hypothetical protein